MNQCTLHTEVEARVSVLESSDERQDVRLKDHDTALERLKDRLPTWATAVIALLMGVAGWLAK